MKPSDLPIPHPQSTLFTIRVWYETLSAETDTVRMQVKHVLSGETRYFQGWKPVTEYLENKVQKMRPTQVPEAICGRTNE